MPKTYLLTRFPDESSPTVGTCIRFDTLDDLKQHVAIEAAKSVVDARLDSCLVFEGYEGKLTIDRKPTITIDGLEAAPVPTPKPSTPPPAAYETPKRGRPFGSKNRNHRN